MKKIEFPEAKFGKTEVFSVILVCESFLGDAVSRRTSAAHLFL